MEGEREEGRKIDLDQEIKGKLKWGEDNEDYDKQLAKITEKGHW